MDTSGGQEIVKKVLMLFVGGTIGMTRNQSGVLSPEADTFREKLKSISQLHDKEFQLRGDQRNKDILALPLCGNEYRILYEVKEFVPLLDSSSVSSDQWTKVALSIKEVYSEYDGFVVAHGTDTLVYTASALSFMITNLGKPIILTGSQLPIDNKRSDGVSNLQYSLIIAGAHRIPEVCIFFDRVLLRGNRAVKYSTDSFDGFTSPNLEALATVGCQIVFNLPDYEQPTNKECIFQTDLNSNVIILILYPDISEKMIKSALEPPTEGVILLTYGSGNIPLNKPYIIDAIKGAIERNVLVVNCSQCLKGSVRSIYETNQVLTDLGAVSGSDMTMEASYTKLRYILSLKNLSYDEKKLMMKCNIRGELTP